jgi:hypothetical protein
LLSQRMNNATARMAWAKRRERMVFFIAFVGPCSYPIMEPQKHFSFSP